MSYKYKYHAWMTECTRIINKARKDRRRKKFSAVTVINDIIKLGKKNKRQYIDEGLSTNSILGRQNYDEFHDALLPTLSSDEETFKNYMRMTISQFHELLSLVGPLIVKPNAKLKSISIPAQLAMTLRYLATGECMASIAYHYPVEVATVATIIGETCKALWTGLHEKVLAYPLEPQGWLDIAADFEQQWDFNHCIGAIDGKHVVIQCPDNAVATGSNAKKSYNIVMLGICDANYMFTFIDIGAYSRRNGGGIFRNSSIGQKFNEKKMNLPQPEHVTVDGDPLPYVLVGDEAFQLSYYLLRPYSKKGFLNRERIIFNHRLSRARKAIENTFGILIAQWRILKKPIEATVDDTMTMIQAIVCLHNWLRKQDIGHNEYIPDNIVDQFGPNGFIPGRWRGEVESSAFQDISTCGPNNCSRFAMTIRDEFCDFFNSEGAVSWQYYCE